MSIHIYHIDCDDGFKGVYNVYGVMDVSICQDLPKCILYINYNLKLFLKI